MVEHKLTCVSGYWKTKNKHGSKYNEWFKNTLKINCPYVFFGDKESIGLVKKYRSNLPTYYIELDVEEFITYKYKDNMITNTRHCPSVKLNLIWNEKLFLVQKAFKLNPFSSDFFMWIDAGICVYRHQSPPTSSFPNLDKLVNLPTDKFIYSSSSIYNENKFKKGKYHLHHHVSAGTFILHKNIIEKCTKIYSEYLKLIDKNDIWTEQVILTLMYKNNPSLFYKYCDGYGTICSNLF